MIDQFAYLTSDLPGIGGVIKQRPEDFLVQEQPLYSPSGCGEHLYLFVEKRLRSTSDVIRYLANTFRVGKGDVGYAGLKDKRAVTQQHFSVRLPAPDHDRQLLARMDHPCIKLLWAQRHENKLKRGHLAGNRFVIRIRCVQPDQAVRVKRILDWLSVTGVPNFVGQQRFGYRMVNHKIGRLLLLGRWQELLDLMLGHPLESNHAPTRAARSAYERGDYRTSLETLPRHLHADRQATDALRQGKSPKEVVLAINRHQRDFFISAVQSAVFNRVLDRRLREAGRPGINRVIEGDLAWKHETRSVFEVDQATADCENADGGRVRTLEVSPSGPMWGVGMCRTKGGVDKWEQEALAQEHLTEQDLCGGSQGRANGSRRPLRVVIRDAAVSGGVDELGPYVEVAFGLPRGSFATVVLREIMKTAVPESVTG